MFNEGKALRTRFIFSYLIVKIIFLYVVYCFLMMLLKTNLSIVLWTVRLDLIIKLPIVSKVSQQLFERILIMFIKACSVGVKIVSFVIFSVSINDPFYKNCIFYKKELS